MKVDEGETFGEEGDLLVSGDGRRPRAGTFQQAAEEE